MKLIEINDENYWKERKIKLKEEIIKYRNTSLEKLIEEISCYYKEDDELEFIQTISHIKNQKEKYQRINEKDIETYIELLIEKEKLEMLKSYESEKYLSKIKNKSKKIKRLKVTSVKKLDNYFNNTKEEYKETLKGLAQYMGLNLAINGAGAALGSLHPSIGYKPSLLAATVFGFLIILGGIEPTIEYLRGLKDRRLYNELVEELKKEGLYDLLLGNLEEQKQQEISDYENTNVYKKIKK